MLILPSSNGQESYVLNRSIALRGTPHFERITGPSGMLQFAEEFELVKKLKELTSSVEPNNPCSEILSEFIAVMSARLKTNV